MCPGPMLQVAVQEDGHAEVTLPVENWRDIKRVFTEPDLGAAAQVLLADQQIRIYNAPGSLVVGVCIEYYTPEEKQARALAAVDEVHGASVAEAQAAVDAAKYQLDRDAARNAEALADAEGVLKAAQDQHAAARAEVNGG